MVRAYVLECGGFVLTDVQNFLTLRAAKRAGVAWLRARGRADPVRWVWVWGGGWAFSSEASTPFLRLHVTRVNLSAKRRRNPWVP